MKIEHIALWVNDLEKMKEFYVRYFNLNCGDIYSNPSKRFTSYFLSFENGARIELMYHPDIVSITDGLRKVCGYAHIAISVGSKKTVDSMTEIFRNDGFIIAGEPRTTGDGYYESVIIDPEGNTIELTV